MSELAARGVVFRETVTELSMSDDLGKPSFRFPP